MARSGYAKGANSGHVTTERPKKVKPSHRKGVSIFSPVAWKVCMQIEVHVQSIAHQWTFFETKTTFSPQAKERFYAEKLPVRLQEWVLTNAEFWIWSRLEDLPQTSASTNLPRDALVLISVPWSREKISRTWTQRWEPVKLAQIKETYYLNTPKAFSVVPPLIVSSKYTFNSITPLSTHNAL